MIKFSKGMLKKIYEAGITKKEMELFILFILHTECPMDVRVNLKKVVRRYRTTRPEDWLTDRFDVRYIITEHYNACRCIPKHSWESCENPPSLFPLGKSWESI